eukprot:8231905-Karenia_brevis.AAC.1
MKAEPFSDWLIGGPRTAAWCVAFIDRRGGGAIDHHRQFKTSFRVNKGDWGVELHEVVMRAADHFATYDGLDLSNAVGMEDLFRQAQLIEYSYLQESGDPAGGKGKNKGTRLVAPEEAAVFTGTHRDSGEVMVCPDLLDFVSKEIERDASIMKQIRKAREEREQVAKSRKGDKSSKKDDG